MDSRYKEASETITRIKNYETIEMDFADYHFFLITLSRYKIPFDLSYLIKISDKKITLTGVKDEPTRDNNTEVE